MSETIKNLEWRYATKKYDTAKKLSDAQLHIIKESLRLSPSSFGVQPWAFIHITNPEIREKLKAAAWNQSQVTDASDLFVLCARTTFDEAYVDEFMEFTAKTHGVAVENLAEYKKMIMGAVARPEAEKAEWMTRQVYVALGVALAVAAENHIDATPMEGFDPKAFDQILGLTDLGLASRVVLAVGFRADDDKYKDGKKVRFPESDVFVEK